MANNKKNQKLLQASRLLLLVPIFILFAMTVVTAVLIILYNNTNNKAFVIASVINSFVFLGGYIFLILYIIRRLRRTFYDNVYKRTLDNLDKLSNSDINIETYDYTKYEEINQLNEKTLSIKNMFKTSMLVELEANYDDISLEYISKKKSLVDIKEFKKKLGNILRLSQSYRNVVIEVYYDLKTASLSKDDKNYLLVLFSKIFIDYPNKLFFFNEDNTSLFIYLPVVDSFSRIKEQLELSINYSGVMVSTINGNEKANAKYSIVAYPFSSEDSIFRDLRIAKRQKQIINLFIPQDINKKYSSEMIMSMSAATSNMTRILDTLPKIEIRSLQKDKILKLIKKAFEEVSSYLDIDNAGIVGYDDATMTYSPLFIIDNSVLFKDIKVMERSFIDIFDSVTDDDGSYYFSTRTKANTKLGELVDLYNVSGGFYYLVKDDEGRVTALIYFCNLDGKPLLLHSYLRESLYVFSLKIAHLFEKENLYKYISLKDSESEYLLSLSRYMLYRVSDDFKLSYVSNDINKSFKNVKVGEYCYKALFGLDKMCNDCPLKQFKKKRVEINGTSYELSLSFNDRKSHNRSVLIEKLNNHQVAGDLFDKDLLVYTNEALVKTIANEYIQSARGYVLLLSLDNYEDFLKSQGSEGYLFSARSLIRKIKDQLKTEDVYLYTPTVLAIHLPNTGHIDIITKCEQIYEISKQHYLDDGSYDQFKITYYPVGYPRGYANEEDFLRHMSEVYRSEKFEKNRDYIYFYSYPIARSASKREHIIYIIKKEFSSLSTQSVSLQPIVSVKDKSIYGAEILLRIHDQDSDIDFNAIEISKIAEQENMTHFITDSIVNYVGALYKEYGTNTFKINHFNRVAINIDQTYLNDLGLVRNVVKLTKDNNIPRNFISFEMPEEMIANNVNKVNAFTKELIANNIFLSVDRYMGTHIGVAKLKDLGFNEIKIARDLIIGIEKDAAKYKEVSEIVRECKKVGLTVSAVGVENKEQYRLLRELDENMLVQGYYLYKPLSRSDLISAIVSYEK